MLVAVVLIGLLVVIGVAIGATFTAALTAAVISLAASAFVVALLHRGASLVDAWGDWPWYQKVAGVFVAIGAAAGDVVGITGFVEGIFEEDLVTGRDLSPEEASERLWTGVFSLATAGLIHWFMRPAAAPTGEAPPGELGPGEPAPLELGPGEPVPLELGPGEPAPLQLGPGEPAPLQLGPGETPAEVAPGEAPPPELAPTESAPSDLGPVQTAPAEVSSTGAADRLGNVVVSELARTRLRLDRELGRRLDGRALRDRLLGHRLIPDLLWIDVQQREAGQPEQAASKAARKLALAEAKRVGLERAIEVARQRGRADADREELIDRVPVNWGTNLTLLGAIRLSGWVVLTSMFATANKDRFVA
ncbi:MAG: hypothetical protein H6708_11310 [Kofleriaceae bacterium]|nr:hypothetical protein [Kofleriaceae bacterium]